LPIVWSWRGAERPAATAGAAVGEVGHDPEELLHPGRQQVFGIMAMSEFRYQR
jgi:hypothetical protein